MTAVPVKINKAKQNLTVETDDIPQEAFQEIFLLGLSTYLNKGMTKILTKGLEGEALEKANEAALEKAKENLQAIYDNKVKTVKKSASKVSGAVKVEARRLARAIVKELMKERKMKVSHYTAAEITKAADAMIETDPTILETAKANVEARIVKAKEAAASVDLSAMQEDPELVAKANARKAPASAKEPLPTMKAKPKVNA